MVIDGDWTVFGIGCAGGVIAELLHWWNLREAAQLPTYGSSPFYWAVTVAMTIAGGFVAWLYFGGHAEGIIAFHVGISTPLILQKLVTSVPQAAGAKNVVVKPSASIRNFFTW
ncbi:hypothetical protein X769_15520 [Mesorhizobium sp. LSJC268A00]|uniref:hypothetical protein n=1 Tax=unclassified Mesorhizobium TaxID=325217 RepID=UPI0003CEF82E|nr:MULTISPECIES: hypothetical protein [unclassified Mesorhizobium]ESX03896.1 hypothetical protein X769_15520 [Mesorhizobium sp. LSJC268A00]ESZ06296.1 hypothetical protein X735_31245 [Mesorhizobium sp. L2C085B000]